MNGIVGYGGIIRRSDGERLGGFAKGVGQYCTYIVSHGEF